MKRCVLSLMVVAGILAIAGCPTLDNLAVDLGDLEVIYISPANNDGVQDTVSISPSDVPLDRTRLERYSVTVVDADGEAVRQYEENAPETPRARRNEEAVEVDDIVLWDGRDDSGSLVPDGEYTLIVQVWDNRDNTGLGPDQRVVVDNTAPYAEVSSPFLAFTPNGDDRLDTLPIYQRNSTTEDEWLGEVKSQYDEVVHTLTWSGTPEDFAWDGYTDAGRVARDGQYYYLLSATDRAGNSAEIRLAGIQLSTEPDGMWLNPSRTSFSPNGDGRGDTVVLAATVQDTDDLDGWRIEIRDITGAALRVYTGAGTPSSVTFDGKRANGAVLPDGPYVGVLSLTYGDGRAPVTASPTLTIDTIPPTATIRLSSDVFSPNGDGLKDTVQVLQSSSEEGTWSGLLTESDGTLVRSQDWVGQVADFSWDGTDSSGALMPDGSYSYRLEATDEAENVARLPGVRIRLDTGAVPVWISSESERFSPNGDGLEDYVSFALGVEDPSGIERWSLLILDSEGRDVGAAVQGTRTVPAAAQWDGSIDGEPVADASYWAQLNVVYDKGTISTAEVPIQVDTTGPDLSVAIDPELFSPDDDGFDDRLTISVSASDETSILRWELAIYDPTGQLFIVWNGAGDPPESIEWNGLSPSGELVQAAEDYQLVATATDPVWNTTTVEMDVPIDILVIREGDRLRIRVSSIYFDAYTDDFLNLDDPERAAHNVQTLDRLAHFLERYPEHHIRIEGHAVSLLWADPEAAAAEQRDVLLPLSRARANAIMAALVERGVDPDRMSTVGYGGSRPVVPHSDLLNRWKSRRVEFILEQ